VSELTPDQMTYLVLTNRRYLQRIFLGKVHSALRDFTDFIFINRRCNAASPWWWRWSHGGGAGSRVVE